jgi:hypothetical protein
MGVVSCFLRDMQPLIVFSLYTTEKGLLRDGWMDRQDKARMPKSSCFWGGYLTLKSNLQVGATSEISVKQRDIP